jgi:hypothetical protein
MVPEFQPPMSQRIASKSGSPFARKNRQAASKVAPVLQPGLSKNIENSRSVCNSVSVRITDFWNFGACFQIRSKRPAGDLLGGGWRVSVDYPLWLNARMAFFIMDASSSSELFRHPSPSGQFSSRGTSDVT